MVEKEFPVVFLLYSAIIKSSMTLDAVPICVSLSPDWPLDTKRIPTHSERETAHVLSSHAIPTEPDHSLKNV